VFGGVAQIVGETKTGFEWLVVAIAVAIGGLIASEFIIGWQAFEPVWEGLALVPALIGGLVVGIVAEVVTRFSTGGTYFGRPMSA
jgi:vancomycin permeability regulator SanA